MPDGGTKLTCHACKFFEARADRKYCIKHNITLPFSFEIICRDCSYKESDRDHQDKSLKQGILYYYYYPEDGSYYSLRKELTSFQALKNRLWHLFINDDQEYGWSIIKHDTSFADLNFTLGFDQFPQAGTVTIQLGQKEHSFEVITTRRVWGKEAVDTKVIYCPEHPQVFYEWLNEHLDMPRIMEKQRQQAIVFANLEADQLQKQAPDTADPEGLVWPEVPKSLSEDVKDFSKVKVFLEELQRNALYKVHLDRHFQADYVK